MNRNLLLVLFSSVFMQLNAQLSLEKRIPKQAKFVLSFNLNSLSQKVNFNDLGNYNFLKKPDIEQYIMPNVILKELFRLPDKAAINRSGKLFIYTENHDSISNLTYLIAISNAKTFETRMVDILETKQYEAKFKKDGKVKTLTYDHKLSITITKDYVIISSWQLPYYYSYDYDEYNESKNKVIMIIDSTKYANMPLDTTSYEPDETPSDSLAIEEQEPLIAIPEEVAAPDTTIAEEVSTLVDAVAAQVEETEYYDNTYDNDSLIKQFERKWAAKRKAREAEFYGRHDLKMAQRQKNINDLKPADCIAVNPEFVKIFTNKDDIIYWFDYQSYSQQLIDMMGNKNSYNYDTVLLKEKLKNPPKNQLAEFLENNSMYGLGNFNQGEIKMNFYNSFNSVSKPFVEKIYSGTINADFFKYIKSDNLMGLMGFSINTEAATNLYYEVFRRASESNAIPNKWAIAAMEMTDMFLDKNAIHHTFKGDAVIAFTGIKSYLHNYSSYEYDSLTFENRTVEKTKTDYIPEFTAILTIENMANVKRILRMIQRFEGLIEVSNNVYSFKSKDKEMNGLFYVVIKDNLLFITNDKPLATEQIFAGLSTERTVGNNYNSYLNNSSFGFWDASKMFKLMAEGPEQEFGKPDELDKWSKKINKGFFVSKPMDGNTTNTEVTLEMKNRENSSFLELLKLFDDIYLMNKFKF